MEISPKFLIKNFKFLGLNIEKLQIFGNLTFFPSEFFTMEVKIQLNGMKQGLSQ